MADDPPRDLALRRPVISTRKHLDYALGYLELGLLAGARDELAAIPAAEQDGAEVLAVRLELAMASESWTKVIALGSRLSRVTPEHERPWVAWAYALREKQRVAEALKVLSAGEKTIRSPGPLVDYNLACYHALLGDLAEARRRLKRACAREPAWKTEAASDPDLAALHGDLNG